jgi:hypothetical protein
MQLANNFGLLPPDTIALDPGLDGIEQLLLVQRFGQELDGPGFDGAARCYPAEDVNGTGHNRSYSPTAPWSALTRVQLSLCKPLR